MVVDTSVAIKWFLPEPHAEAADKVLASECDILAPDIIWAEFGNALLKKVRFNEISIQQASDILRDFIHFPLETCGSKSILSDAWHLAHQARNSVYDNLYLALAIKSDCLLVTADRKFYDSQKSHSPMIVWIEDFHS